MNVQSISDTDDGGSAAEPSKMTGMYITLNINAVSFLRVNTVDQFGQWAYMALVSCKIKI